MCVGVCGCETTINTLIQIMKNMIQEKINREVYQAKYYSIQVDSTQDNTSIDQFGIIIRYVLKSIICKRLLSVVQSNDALMVQDRDRLIF